MDILTALRTCRSVRSFSPRAIPDEALRGVLEQLRLAPSASNNQPWRFVVVRDPETKRQIASAARNQHYIAEAPVIVVACGDPNRAQDFAGGMGNSLRIDVAMAFDRMMLAAVAEGLGACWIGAYDHREIQAILGIPDPIQVVGLTPLGYPSDPAMLRPIAAEDRLPFEDVVSWDHYPKEYQNSTQSSGAA